MIDMSEYTQQVTGLKVLDEGVTVVNPATAMDFVGAGVAATDGGNSKATVTVGGGGSGYQAPVSGTVDGNNKVFVFATAPSVVIVDQGRAMQKTSSDDSTNWTGTTTITLSVAPTSDIYAAS